MLGFGLPGADGLLSLPIRSLADETPDSLVASRVASSAAPFGGRSSGRLERQLATNPASCGVIPPSVSGAGISVKCAAINSYDVRLSAKGCWPASSSYASIPHA